MMKTKTRWIPEGFKEFAPELEDYPKDMFACYVNVEQPHNPKAIFFTGKQTPHTWYNRFTDIPQMKAKINKTITNLMEHEEYKDKRKADRILARKNMDTTVVKVGDIYHWSGGYNCTRNYYVKVVAPAGKNKFTVIELPKTQVDGDWMNGNVAPIVDFTTDKTKVFTARPAYNGGIMLRDTKGYHDNYYKWNGKPNWENCD